MNTLSKKSLRGSSKNKGKRKKNKKVHSGNSIEESSNEHIGLSSNNMNKSFLSESSDTLNDDLIGLSKQHLTYPKNLIIGHLNINSVRNKFSSLQQTVLSKTDILLLSETKIDDSFPNSLFFAEGFKMYRKDRTKTGEGLLLYVNENLPGKIINTYKFKESPEIILYEFRVSNKMCLKLGNYRPPSQNDLSFISELNFALNFFSPIYENFVLLGDFNLSTENPNLKNFMYSFDLESLINLPTCCKSTNPICIDLILTNKKNHSMKSATFEIGLYDHHKLIITILRKTISKGNSKKMFYRDYKKFDQKKFETELKLKLNSQTNLSYSTFQAVFLEILNKIAPVKVKVLRFNKSAFMTKSLRKVVMVRSRLKNNFNKQRADENCDN